MASIIDAAERDIENTNPSDCRRCSMSGCARSRAIFTAASKTQAAADWMNARQPAAEASGRQTA